jgi:diguanylate cyclase (GGDEF)-like protein
MTTAVLSKAIDILLVENSPEDVKMFRKSLAETGEDHYELTCVGRLTDTIQELDNGEYNIIIMDLSLPDSQGFNTFISVRMHAPGVPIILLTDVHDEDLAVKALQNGAQDYLMKGQVDGNLLSRSIRYAIERNNATQKQHRLAYFDALTDLPNRTLFNDRLKQAIAHAHRYEKKVGLMFIDLDDFKMVNDTMGHDTGDLLLQSVARRMESCLRKSDTVARIGGDEFTCILPHIEKKDDIKIVAKKIISALTTPFELKGQKVQISGSVGASLFPDHTEDFEKLIKNADVAMYHAKKRGKKNFKVFSESLNRKTKPFSPLLTTGLSFIPRAQEWSRKLKQLGQFK